MCAHRVLDLAELHTQPLSPVTLLSSSSSSSVSLSSRNLPFSWSNVLSPSVSLDSGLASLRALVGRLSSATDAKLVSLVRDKHRFEAHCRLLKRYLLLGQGDFIQHLLQALWEELNKDATQVHKHALKGLLDQAVRVSHVSDEDEVLERLDIRLLPATRGDTGRRALLRRSANMSACVQAGKFSLWTCTRGPRSTLCSLRKPCACTSASSISCGGSSG